MASTEFVAIGDLHCMGALSNYRAIQGGPVLATSLEAQNYVAEMANKWNAPIGCVGDLSIGLINDITKVSYEELMSGLTHQLGFMQTLGNHDNKIEMKDPTFDIGIIIKSRFTNF